MVSEERFYREWMGRGSLQKYAVCIEESDLSILTPVDLSDLAYQALAEVRRELGEQIERQPEFADSLKPLASRVASGPTVASMLAASHMWNVGPMAAVAGAVAEAVGRALLEHTCTVIVENGGDVFAKAKQSLRFGLYAGAESPFRDRLIFEVDASAGIGVCTSSAKIGPSLSFGVADAVVAFAPSSAVADCAATALANEIQAASDIDHVINRELNRSVLDGLMICCEQRIGMWGGMRLMRSPAAICRPREEKTREDRRGRLKSSSDEGEFDAKKSHIEISR